MKKFIFIFLLLGCASSIKYSNLTQSISKLHNQKINKVELRKLIRISYREDKKSIILPAKSSSKMVKVIFSFEKDLLKNIKYYVRPQNLNVALKDINCQWQINDKVYNSINGHLMKEVKEGHCHREKIKFNYRHQLGLYEIEWIWE